MKIRRLTDTGVVKFTKFLDSLTTDSPEPLPEKMLYDNETSEIASDSEVQFLDSLPVNSRFETAKYLCSLINNTGIRHPEHDAGLWAWISLYYFDQICPRNKDTSYKPGAIARWILEPHNYQKYYRHLLTGPWRIYSTYKDKSEIAHGVLANPVHTPGELYEQIASRQEIISNHALVQLSKSLYFNESKGGLKRGAGGSGPGSPRRLADVFQQFSRTWDLYAMSPQQILSLLPSEFDKFKA